MEASEKSLSMWSGDGDSEGLIPGTVAIGFDLWDRKGITIEFRPQCPPSRAMSARLLWTLPTTPESIDSVVQMVGRKRLPVDAIVIGGLERYPIAIDEWVRWLTRWSKGPGPSMIIVDTDGMIDEQRRRLICGLRREIVLRETEDPVAMVVTAVRQWINGRL